MSTEVKLSRKSVGDFLGACMALCASKTWVHLWACGFVFGLFAATQILSRSGALNGFAIDSLELSPVSLSVLALSLSAFMCSLVLLTQRFHAHLSMDDDLEGVQKLHSAPVPRIGGLPVFVALFASLAFAIPAGDFQFGLFLLLASLPVFLAGLWEDLTKSVSARQRLIWSMVSGFLASWLLNAIVTDLGVGWVNAALAFTPFAMLFSAFAMAGMANAINIIDGLNGLAAGVVCLTALALGFVAVQFSDTLLLAISVSLAFSMLGFWLFNFPFGKIFLGDGGAYLMGVLLGALAILLKARNPELDSWMILSLLAYPVVEVLFSVYRRLRTQAAPDQPDFAHFHQLVQRVMVDVVCRRRGSVQSCQLNSNATPFLWCFCAFSLVLAFVGQAMGFGALGFLLTALAYIVSYQWLAAMVRRIEAVA